MNDRVRVLQDRQVAFRSGMNLPYLFCAVIAALEVSELAQVTGYNPAEREVQVLIQAHLQDPAMLIMMRISSFLGLISLEVRRRVGKKSRKHRLCLRSKGFGVCS